MEDDGSGKGKGKGGGAMNSVVMGLNSECKGTSLSLMNQDNKTQVVE
jgi:hypothetical protein